MRCGCPHCGTYMIQREKGLNSGCVCPACLFACAACMGTEQPPLKPEELQLHLLMRQRADGEHCERCERSEQYE